MIKRVRFNSKKNIKRSGFTLVELIVVIVIILVLAAVLVPSVLRYVAKSQEAKCKSGRSTLATEYALAVADGRIPWDIEINDKTIKGYQDSRILPEFSCPMGGKIYALRNDDGTVVIRCGYHDDGVRGSGGGDGMSWGNLYDQMVKFVGEHPEYHSGGANSTFLKKFYGDKNPEDVVAMEKVSDILTDNKIDDLVKKFKNIQPDATEENIKKMLKDLQESSYPVAPFVCEDGKVVMYYAADDLWKTQYHGGTNLLYYDGEWYLSPEMNWHKTELSQNKSLLPTIRKSKNMEQTIKDYNLIKIT